MAHTPGLAPEDGVGVNVEVIPGLHALQAKAAPGQDPSLAQFNRVPHIPSVTQGQSSKILEFHVRKSQALNPKARAPNPKSTSLVDLDFAAELVLIHVSVLQTASLPNHSGIWG